MRLPKNPSKKITDLTWVPVLQDLMYPAREVHDDIPTASPDSYITNPDGDYTPDELKMIRSGAKYQDIMFMRALKYRNNLFERKK